MKVGHRLEWSEIPPRKLFWCPTFSFFFFFLTVFFVSAIALSSEFPFSAQQMLFSSPCFSSCRPAVPLQSLGIFEQKRFLQEWACPRGSSVLMGENRLPFVSASCDDQHLTPRSFAAEVVLEVWGPVLDHKPVPFPRSRNTPFCAPVLPYLLPSIRPSTIFLG